jgi:superoxide dismutase, Cu-Zn family
MRLILMASCFAVIAMPAAAQQATTSPSVARAVFLSANGDSIGTATLKETPNGVLIQAKLENVPPGIHGVHIHETGACDASGGFESAGGHYAPGGSKHGFMVEGGPHAGDMINQTANDDGTMVIEIFNTRISFDTGEAPLFDDDGSAIVVHATADDYTAQPAGASGDRIACAVIEQ